MTNVYHRHRALTTLFRDLPPGFTATIRPDHPLLLRAPDALVGGDGLLTALYLPTTAERRYRLPLSARFVLNRLALPAYTRHVLFPEEGDEDLADSLAAHFDAVIAWSDREKIIFLVQDRYFRSRHEQLPPETVAAVAQQYADAMQITHAMRLLYDRRRRVSDHDIDRPDTQSDLRASRRPLLEREDVFRGPDRVPIVRYTARRVTSAIVLEIVNQHTDEIYHLDDGVPYRDPHILPGMAVIESLPNFPNDPDKVARAAAFGGWALIRQDQAEVLPRLVHRLTERWDSRRGAAGQ